MSKQLVTQNSTGMVLAFTPEQKELIRNTVAKGASDDEMALFLHLAQTYGLDPFAKEIFCMKYGNQAATIITGRDGYLKIANGRPEMDGIQSDSVCKNDLLTKKPDGTVDHTYGTPERGPLIGAYALVFRKDRSRAAYFYAPMGEYNAGSNPIWKKYPTAMIIKVAEACALKRAFSISGLVTQEEMDVSQEQQWQPAQVHVETVQHQLQQPVQQPVGRAQVEQVQPSDEEREAYTYQLQQATSKVELRELFTSIPKQYAEAFTPLAKEIATSFTVSHE